MFRFIMNDILVRQNAPDRTARSVSFRCFLRFPNTNLIRIHVTVEHERLFITVFGFKLELFFQSEAAEQIDFYAKAAYVRISFRKNFSGKTDGATIHWLGEKAYYAKRRDGQND